MYLKTVSELAEATEQVAISALARRLGVSTVSATEMVHRLEDQGLVEHVPYQGISLTEEGEAKATTIIRSHQLWECFLADHLQLPWEQVHDMACRLEHATDRAVTEALAEYLKHPRYCPHGNPIPGPDGASTAIDGTALAEMSPGQQGVVQAIYPESTLLLEHLSDYQIRPGVTITLTDIAPFNGPMMVTVRGDRRAIGQEVAAHIFVTLDENHPGKSEP